MGMVCARAASAARAIMSGSSEPSSSARTPARSSRRPRRVACSIASVDSKMPRTTTGKQPQRRRESADRAPPLRRRGARRWRRRRWRRSARARRRERAPGRSRTRAASRRDSRKRRTTSAGSISRRALERTRRARARDRRSARTRRARAHARCRPGRRRRSRCRRRLSSAASVQKARIDRRVDAEDERERARGARVWNDGLAIGTVSCARGTTSSASAYSCART